MRVGRRGGYILQRRPNDCLALLSQELLCGNQTIKTKGGEVTYSNGTKEWPITESRFGANVARTQSQMDSNLEKGMLNSSRPKHKNQLILMILIVFLQ
jgi:hypothetical protein